MSAAPQSEGTLDATGLMCPLPVLKARKALKALRAGCVPPCLGYRSGLGH